jgi:ferritin-like metal-binding protein YciE
MDQRALELLEHGIRDMYDAEQRFVQSLEKMERNADDPSLAKGFRRHKDVTENQVKRLEKAFREMDKEPRREPCAAAKGLVTEYDTFVMEHRGGNGLLDAFAANAGLKVEHYEIASYRALVNLAEFCDLDGVAKLLSETLAEEEQAAAEMMSASMKLGAKLAGASTTKVATRGVASMFDHARENTFAAIGGARAVTGRAADRVASARRTTKAKAKASKRKAKSPAKRTTSRAKTTARSASKTAKRKPARKPTRKRTTARATTRRPARKMSRKPTARRSTRSTTRRRSAR